jgi:hypothetical protein
MTSIFIRSSLVVVVVVVVFFQISFFFFFFILVYTIGAAETPPKKQESQLQVKMWANGLNHWLSALSANGVYMACSLEDH